MNKLLWDEFWLLVCMPYEDMTTEQRDRQYYLDGEGQLCDFNRNRRLWGLGDVVITLLRGFSP